MRKQMLLIAFLTIAFVLSGCAAFQPAPVTVTEHTSLRRSPEVSPNFDFIAITGVDGLPTDEDNLKIIGHAVLVWEQNHPERKIVSISPVWSPPDSYGGKFYGLFIYSEFAERRQP